MYGCRQNCQWNQKDILAECRMKDDVAGSQSSALCLTIATGLDVRQMYLSGKSQLPHPKIALPGWYFFPATERERDNSTLSGEMQRAEFLAFIHATHIQLQIAPPFWQVPVQWAYPAGCSSGVYHWKSWDIHFAFFETNYIFAICIHKRLDALFRKGSTAWRP